MLREGQHVEYMRHIIGQSPKSHHTVRGCSTLTMFLELFAYTNRFGLIYPHDMSFIQFRTYRYLCFMSHILCCPHILYILLSVINCTNSLILCCAYHIGTNSSTSSYRSQISSGEFNVSRNTAMICLRVEVLFFLLISPLSAERECFFDVGGR